MSISICNPAKIIQFIQFSSRRPRQEVNEYDDYKRKLLIKALRYIRHMHWAVNMVIFGTDDDMLSSKGDPKSK